MKKTALICGSYAFDSIMLFGDKFKNHILPDKIHRLNLAFYVPKMRKEMGGCAGNIAYNLHLLGDTALPMATVGMDFAPYQAKLNALGIDDRYIKVIADNYTAQAFITTDQDNNQITIFHPGAMSVSHLNDISTLHPCVDIAIVSPDAKDGMICHAKQLVELNIPFIFDPGQGLPMFSKQELTTFVAQANWITVNDYELELLLKTTQLSIEELANQVLALIVTKGEKGASIYYDKQVLDIDGLAVKSVDPTGCGDAYRAGLLFGITRGLEWKTTAQLANLIGAIKVVHQGTQNHRFDLASIQALYLETYKQPLLAPTKDE